MRKGLADEGSAEDIAAHEREGCAWRWGGGRLSVRPDRDRVTAWRLVGVRRWLFWGRMLHPVGALALGLICFSLAGVVVTVGVMLVGKAMRRSRS